MELVGQGVQLQSQDKRIGEARLLMDELRLPTETMPTPTRVDCAVNVLWKRTRLLCPGGGGVSIQADKAIQRERLESDNDGELGPARLAVGQRVEDERWWWD